MRRFLTLLALALLALRLLIQPMASYGQDTSEAAVKTAFLYNFFKFVDFPDSDNLTQYTLCTYQDDLGDSLLTLLDKQVAGKPLIVLRTQDLEQLKHCQIAYLGVSAATVAAQLKSFPVLTVGSAPNFAEQGGIIGFTVKDNRLSFEVNLATATLAHVYINAKLLKLARYVYSD